MDPLIGKTLSGYDVLARIGAGGMGVVYLARDNRLRREVAIKLIPAEMAAESGRASRFLREARVLASLNHPNIAAIYGIERSPEVGAFLVLEHVEGETLAERLQRGPLPAPEALRVCGAIAAALEAAHERGVIHRDLKPANVMITPRGEVKVLDFGLARHVRHGPGGGPGEEPTSSTATGTGHIVGTPGYMSPEQILGQRQDWRVDVFGFGCVLYECLTGRKAFPAGTAFPSHADPRFRGPDWSALPVGTPRRLRALLARCLERDPEQRIAEIRLVRRELQSIEAGAHAGPAAGDRAAPGNLPEELTSFIGRETELRECLDLAHRSRLVTLTGTGGCGKTRLAVKLAEGLRDLFPDGVWFVDLSSIGGPDRVAPAVASTLGIADRAGETAEAVLIEYLADKRTLLVLDNCEHLLGSCAGLATRLLQHCRDVVLFATSREPLHVSGEQVYPVPTLEVPGAEAAPGDLERFESVRLFVERAQATSPHFRLTATNAPVVADICRKLDGIPLAIELAAARIRLLSPEEIRGMLGERFRLLVDGSALATPRHQTLAATIDWSYEQLDAGEQRLFRALSVFAGGWGITAGVAICGAGEDRLRFMEHLTRLLDKSLLVVDRGPAPESRWRYLETVRQYAEERLLERGEEAGLRASHVTFFLDLAERAAPELVGPAQATWLFVLETDHENILAAIDECGESAPRLRFAAAMWRFWLARGHIALGRRILEASVRAGAGGAPDPPALARTRAEALIGAGALAFHQNEWDLGRAFFEESGTISRSTGFEEGVGHSLIGLGNIALGRGSYAEARAIYEEGIAQFERGGHRRGVGLAYSNLGRVAELEGDLEAALPLYRRGIEIFREVGDVGSLALRLSSLGDLSLRMGRREEARAQLLESLRDIRNLGEPRAGAFALVRSATLLEQEGRGRDSAVLYGAAEALQRRLGAIMTPREVEEKESRGERLRERLGEGAFEAARAEGQTLAFDAAIDVALDCLGPGSHSRSTP